MRRQDAVNLPAAERLSDEIPATTQEWQIPKARQSESMHHVEVRWATLLTQVLRKSLIGFIAGTIVGQRIDTLGPTINRVKGKSATKATRQTRIHRVVVGVYVRRRNEHRRREVVCRYHRLNEELIHEANQLVSRAALVT